MSEDPGKQFTEKELCEILQCLADGMVALGGYFQNGENDEERYRLYERRAEAYERMELWIGRISRIETGMALDRKFREAEEEEAAGQ